MRQVTQQRSGLRVLDVRNASAANLSEVAFFDVYPVDDQALFNGTWSNYPFFASGTVVLQGIRSVLAVPLGVADKVFGIIYADSRGRISVLIILANGGCCLKT